MKAINTLASVALSVIITLSTLTGCKKSTTDSAPPGGGGGGTTVTYKYKIAYLYKKDSTDAVAYKTLLQANNCGVTLFDSAQVGLADFTKYDLLVIGHNAARAASDYTTQMVGAIKGSGKPVLFIGLGGSHYAEQLGLVVNYGSTATFTGATMLYIVDSSLSLFKSPKKLAISASLQLQVFNAGATVDGFYAASYYNLSSVQMLVLASTSSAKHFSVTVEKGQYGFFGYYDNVNAMTQAGKDFMVNLTYYVGKLS